MRPRGRPCAGRLDQRKEHAMAPWIILGILTSVGAVLLLAPFLRQPAAHAAHDVAASLDRIDGDRAARGCGRAGRRAGGGGPGGDPAADPGGRSRRGSGALVQPRTAGRPGPRSPASRSSARSAFYAAYGSLDLSDDGRSVPAAARQDDRDGAAAVAALAAATAQTLRSRSRSSGKISSSAPSAASTRWSSAWWHG